MSLSHDSTSGPAKWAAVAVLGGASVFGLLWSIVTRAPAAAATPVPAAAPMPTGDRAPAPVRPVASAPASKLININTANSRELELLPGIGPALAARIIAYRTENGAFRSVDDLDNVKGVGPRTLDRLRPMVTVDH
jgi:competence protein ComEA